jgi:HD-GYP domain-containing protein (c-di-GMP phosphodiesterase class II)
MVATATSVESVPRDTVEVRLEELIIGRELSSPIYDRDGVLLLSSGAQITPEFKKLLRNRRLRSIQVSTGDLQRITTRVLESDESTSPTTMADDVTQTLDSMIDSGLLLVANNGPAAKSSVVFHGRKAFTSARLEQLKNQRTESVDQIGQMMKESLRGRVSASDVSAVTAQYLAEFSDDSDAVLSVAMEASHDKCVADHCLKMAVLGMAIGVEMDLDAENCKRIFMTGLVHDWGQVRVPEEIRHADRPLTDDEVFQLRKHPIHTAEMLERMAGIPSTVQVASYQIHERPNGRGYPRGRSGNRIHLFAKILQVADVYVQLCRPCRGRPALTPYAAMEAVLRLVATRDLDGTAARALLQTHSLFPIGSHVALTDGSVGRVIRRNREDYSRPFVQVVQDPGGERIEASDDAIICPGEGGLEVIQALPNPGRHEVDLTEELLSEARRQL